MSSPFQQITPCLWFDTEAEEAARYYVDVFPGSGIRSITRYGSEGREIHGRPDGSVMTVEFDLRGQPFTALNGGPVFRLNEAISFQVLCDSQDEIDHYWDRLSDGGDPSAQQCGWLKDRFGVSWQVVPAGLKDLLAAEDSDRAQRVTRVLLEMKKLDIQALQEA
jgi:predicted 3-demethylubiquinone-9 3-methyltransferase (glyoxalase superfamily)